MLLWVLQSEAGCGCLDAPRGLVTVGLFPCLRLEANVAVFLRVWKGE